MTSRLPRTAIPSHYDLIIRTDLARRTFSGTCEIELRVTAPISSVTLNVHLPAKLEACVLGRLDQAGTLVERRQMKQITIDAKLQRATLEFEGGTIPAGMYQLGCRWTGELDETVIGYYAGTHEVEGLKKAYAMTQFQPCDARRAYPCFDEPDLKATFSISMISRVGTTSLSNMNVESVRKLERGGPFPRTQLLADDCFSSEAETSSDQDEWELVRFGKTPKMSSYLAAWANGEFAFVEGGCHSALSKRFITMRVYTLPHEVYQAEAALRTNEKVLPVLERFFDLDFPLPKLDTLATPGFGNGAMENWGLIIGGSSVYLIDEAKAGTAAKKMLVAVAAHEIAHQWFGNLTTMEWWDALWLNEAFATIVGEVTVLEEIEPSWRTTSEFIAQHLSRALQLDAVRSSHPIEMPCPDEATINQIFDAVSYSKGGSVLKMLSNFVGQEKFLKGVSTYLKRHLYGNAATADLFKGISDMYGQDISGMMENWTTKIGFPLITVEETEKGLKIRQNRFLSTADATPEEDQTIWHVPLEPLVVEGGKKSIKHGVLLTDREDTFEIDDVKNSTYKLNAETCGVFRVLYPAERLVKIGEEAGKENSAFSLNDRMGLVQDATVLASSGYAKTSTALSLLSQLGNEKENLVWQAIAASMSDLALAWREQPEHVRLAIDRFRCTFFRPILDRLGFEASREDTLDTIELRALAISTLAEAGDDAVVSEYKRRFQPFVDGNDESQIPTDLRNSIFAQAVRYGSAREYRQVLAVYRAPASPAHKKAARAALCSTRDPNLLQETLSMMLSGEVPMHEIASFGMTLRTHTIGAQLYWDWFKTNFETLVGRCEAFYLSQNVAAPISSFSTRKDLEDVKAFFSDKDQTGYEQSVAQKLDAILARVKWLERDSGDVEDWLALHGFVQ